MCDSSCTLLYLARRAGSYDLNGIFPPVPRSIRHPYTLKHRCIRTRSKFCCPSEANLRDASSCHTEEWLFVLGVWQSSV
eukprot:11147-Rhodomonas_salina.2